MPGNNTTRKLSAAEKHALNKAKKNAEKAAKRNANAAKAAAKAPKGTSASRFANEAKTKKKVLSGKIRLGPNISSLYGHGPTRSMPT